ncbi:MAG: helix-turn-helix transcriptional regulator [Asticcacaulis sp.]|uniref:helix-turn-helix domain-containing protein n=1 Tax=Asticcacaulis sp. TaxID=1872648 RepID=UPI0039E60995
MRRQSAKDPGFAAAMKLLRQRAGKSLAELQADVGVSAQAMSRWENAAVAWPDDRIGAYLRAVGASEADLDRELYTVSETAPFSRFSRESAWWQAFPQELESHIVADESMAPWCEPGEKVFFQRGRPPKRMEGCLVELKSGERLVRLYERERDGFLYFRRINPESTEQVLHSQVQAIHRILLRGD